MGRGKNLWIYDPEAGSSVPVDRERTPIPRIFDPQDIRARCGSASQEPSLRKAIDELVGEPVQVVRRWIIQGGLDTGSLKFGETGNIQEELEQPCR
jgi:hypothetical protein